MKSAPEASGINRRLLLSALAAPVVLTGLLTDAQAQLSVQPSAGAVAGSPARLWNDGPTKQAVLNFVARVTQQGGPDFVPPAERIATFDNDGTLWVEHPMYTQMAFILDRVKVMAPLHPEWNRTQPFKAVLEGDMKALAAAGEKGMVELGMATHAGMTTEEFQKIVTDWLATARHPRFKRLYTELSYQPMIELLAYLRANGFKTFIVSGGGVEFMRPWTERVYGVPPEQVVGSSIKTRFQMRDGRPELFRLPEVNFIDDGAGKPVGINEFIGRRPIAAFGNSDGDLEMLCIHAIGCGASISSAQAQQPAATPPAGQKPNILVIMADDIGYWNISAYNRGMMGYRTPNIDRIAKEGAIFTDYYGQQSCNGCRASPHYRPEPDADRSLESRVTW